MSTVYNLPGNGPWRVLRECPAFRHNTLGASRGRGGTEPCVCPRALALHEKEVARTKAWDAKRRAERGQLPPSGLGKGRPSIPLWLTFGPWKVLEECPAPSHNSIYMARGGRYKSEGRCICPHAVFLLQQYLNGEDRAEREKRRIEKAAREAAEQAEIKKIPQPDWGKGLCRIDKAFMDNAFDESKSRTGIKNRSDAKLVCDVCPIMRDCRRWVMQVERDAPGFLGGIYGGLDVWERQGFELFMDGGRVRRRPYVPTL